MRVDEMGVHEVGVDKMGSRSGMTPLIGHVHTGPLMREHNVVTQATTPSCKHVCLMYTPTPHFYIAKLGCTGVYIFFIIARKHRLWVLVK